MYVESGSKLNRHKLDPIREGPFTIIRQISSAFYEVVASGRRRQISNYFHSSKLSPYAVATVAGGRFTILTCI